MALERAVAIEERVIDNQGAIELASFDPDDFHNLLPSWEVRVMEEGKRYHLIHESDHTRTGSDQRSIQVYAPGKLGLDGERDVDSVWSFTDDGSVQPLLNATSFSFERQDDGSFVARFSSKEGDLVVSNVGDIVFEPRSVD